MLPDWLVRLAMRGLWRRAAWRRGLSPVRAAVKRRETRSRALGGRVWRERGGGNCSCAWGFSGD